MKRCIIMRGLPNSGKTTLTAKLAPVLDAIVCSADHWFYTSDGRYDFVPEELPDAHKHCRTNFRGVLKAGKNVIVDNTNLTAAEIAWYYSEAEDAGYDVEIRNVEATFEEILTRTSDKDIPLNVLARMFSTFITEKLPPWWKQTLLTEGGC